MQLERKTVKMHGDKEIHILTPCIIDENLVACHDNKGFEVILGNGTVFNNLKMMFHLAIDLEENEILCCPVSSGVKKYESPFDEFSFYKNIYLMNYCRTQVSIKEINRVENSKIYQNKKITRVPISKTSNIEFWKSDRKLTVKKSNNNLYISTNRDGFTNLSNGAKYMGKYGDDITFNDDPPHTHFDWKENTSKSIGLTMYYWQTI